MQIDPDYLRRHYSSLSDDALFTIDRSDLVEMAQTYFDIEINRRREAEAARLRLEREHVPTWLEEAAEVYSVIAHYDKPEETEAAASARDLLEAAGIPCYLEAKEIPGEGGQNTPPAHRRRLMVPRKLSLRASSTLEREIGNPRFEETWRTHLDGLSDDELLRMSPEVALPGLYDLARRVKTAYKDELARRAIIDLRIFHRH
jgi:hypothetical protein